MQRDDYPPIPTSFPNHLSPRPARSPCLGPPCCFIPYPINTPSCLCACWEAGLRFVLPSSGLTALQISPLFAANLGVSAFGLLCVWQDRCGSVTHVVSQPRGESGWTSGPWLVGPLQALRTCGPAQAGPGASVPRLTLGFQGGAADLPRSVSSCSKDRKWSRTLWCFPSMSSACLLSVEKL